MQLMLSLQDSPEQQRALLRAMMHKEISEEIRREWRAVWRVIVSMVCLMLLCGCQGPQLLKGSGKSATPMPQAQILCIEHPELRLCHAEDEP